MSTHQIVFIAFASLAFGFFAFTVFKIIGNFKLTKKLNRFDKIVERTTLTLLVAFGQKKILKKPFVGMLHALVFWGFLVITVGTIEMLIDGFLGLERTLSFTGKFYSIITASGDIFAVIVFTSCMLFLYRRYIIKPKRFIAPEMKPSSNMDATLVIAMIILLMLSLLGMNTGYVKLHPNDYSGLFPVSSLLANTNITGSNVELFEGINWWTHISLVLLFMNLLPYSKHFHVFLAVPNVFFSRLEPKAKLNNLESVTKEVKLMMNPDTAFASPAEGETPATPERFGVKDVEDIHWKNLMDAYTCTECGRCSAQCPANKTGKILSPRKLYIDLRARMTEKAIGLKSEGPQFTDGKSLIGSYISEEELWACTTCMSCVEQCPVDIDHVPFIIDMRRELVMEESKMPEGIAMMCTNIENNGAPWQFSPSDRFNWAENITLNA